MVFSDDADGGRLKFGCDCGQFHSGVGLTKGIYAFSSSSPGGFVRSQSLGGVPRGGFVGGSSGCWCCLWFGGGCGGVDCGGGSGAGGGVDGGRGGAGDGCALALVLALAVVEVVVEALPWR